MLNSSFHAFLCWITIPRSFPNLRIFPCHHRILILSERTKQIVIPPTYLFLRSYCWKIATGDWGQVLAVRDAPVQEVTTGHWLETGVCHQPRSGWRLYTLQTERPSCSWACATVKTQFWRFSFLLIWHPGVWSIYYLNYYYYYYYCYYKQCSMSLWTI